MILKVVRVEITMGGIEEREREKRNTRTVLSDGKARTLTAQFQPNAGSDS